MNLNKVMLIGNLTRDPEVRTAPAGQTVCSFGLATNRRWTDKSGQRKEQAEFHNIVAWGKLADICGQYLSKGRQTYIEGRLQTRKWQGQDGVERVRTEVIADNMQMLGSRPAGSGSSAGKNQITPDASGGSAQADAYDQIQTEGSSAAKQDSDDEGIKVEEIPF